MYIFINTFFLLNIFYHFLFTPVYRTQKLSKRIQEEYLVNPEMDFASVDRASKACGPLFQWAQSQIRFSAFFIRDAKKWLV